MLAARAWTLVDATSGVTLASSAATQRLEPASLTKLMTAYVVFTAIGEQRTRLDAGVTVSPAAVAAPGRAGARMFVEPGRPVTVDELLRGMLFRARHDAARPAGRTTRPGEHHGLLSKQMNCESPPGF